MSWSICKNGRVRDVKAELALEKRQTFSIAAEQKSYDAARESMLATLDCMHDRAFVFVQASGSAYDDGRGYKSGEVKVSVTSYPIVMLGAPMGAWSEPRAEAEQPVGSGG